MSASTNEKPQITHSLRFRIGDEFISLTGLYTNVGKDGSEYLGISGKSIDNEILQKFQAALAAGEPVNGVYVMTVNK